ncbi:P-loop containing nucleoside triphosphate hydrolase protein [Marasmius fiardii PR-910]|nr:P-loop containing nucleoside triphosphate hydrolase protein [Marasmius fiardii PR-910]
MSSTPAVSHIAQHILKHVRPRATQPLFVAIQGPQGSGKSYLTGLVQSHLSSPPHSLRVATLSIDDLYLPHAQLKSLAKNNSGNPLWKGRGQPGTHDVVLGLQILSSLKKGQMGEQGIELPRFDKSMFDGEGDRLPMDGTGVVVCPPIDLVIVEGWCMGFCPISDREVDQRWDNVWQVEKGLLGMDDSIIGTKENVKQINDVLHRYVDLWSFFDVFIQLKPSLLSSNVSQYSIVYNWRLEQEHYMKCLNGGKGMSDAAVKLFVDRYIPGYVFFGDGVIGGDCGVYTHSESGGYQRNATVPQSSRFPWLGKSLRVVLDTKRNVVGLEEF